MSDNNYSTPFLFNSEVFLGADSGYYRSVQLDSLENLDKHDGNKCFGCNGLSAHPLRDENGNLWNLGMSLTSSLKYNLIKVPGNGIASSKEAMKKGKIICTFPTRRNGILGSSHSFGMTSKYIIVIEQPNYLCMSKILASIVKGDTLKDWFEWCPKDKNRFFVVEKESGRILKTEYMSTESFYFMHFINCYVEDEQVIIHSIKCIQIAN
jgi:carotenoid cleavage dioxygenase-like enzyme